MNIWAWVEATQAELRKSGRGRLAELMDLVPHYMSDNLHEQLDAVMPEALALAREARNPWIELFLRHWNLQSRILQRVEVREFLPEAVSLIELASREDARDCPQSVCVTQDLANCYANLDGPGFAAERLEVARETLSRINADWPCFTCISSEYASAQIDAGDPGAALAFLERQQQALVAIGRAERKEDMVGTTIDALIALGRLEEALALNDATGEFENTDSFTDQRRIDRVRILARLGRTEEAKGVLPPFDRVFRTPSQYEPYADARAMLAQAGVVPNDFSLHTELERMRARLASQGAARRALAISLWLGELAIARGRAHTAAECVSRSRALLPALRSPHRAPEAVAALEQRVAALRERLGAPPPLASPAAVLDTLSGELEADLEQLERAHARWPRHPALAGALADLLVARGDPPGAVDVLRAATSAAPDDPRLVLQLMETLSAAGRHRELAAEAAALLARAREPAIVAEIRLVLARDAMVRADAATARAELEAGLEVAPDDPRARAFLARLEREAGRFGQALEHLEHLIARGAPAGPWDWERMLVGTLLERWDVVRASSARIGTPIPGEGPIELELELCRIQFESEDGAPAYYAIRTGPVTARVVEIAHPAFIQHFADRVIFDPMPRNPAGPEDDPNHVDCFGCVERTESGGYVSFVIDGCHPGEARVEGLRARLAALDCRLELRSDETYAIEDRETGAVHPAIYAFVAVPGGAPLEPVRAAIRDALAGAPGPVIWPQLAAALDDAEEIEAQAVSAERFNL